MLNKISLVVACSILFANSSAFALSEEEAVATCMQYAAEDQVAPDDSENYLIKCINHFSEEVSNEEVSNEEASNEEEAEATCMQYAAEDQVAPDEMENYLAECINNFSEEVSNEEESKQDIAPLQLSLH